MNGKKYLLSICIPTYNRADVLQHCLDAIVNHKLTNSGLIEIVVCDNASTDGTKSLMQKYSELSYVKYFCNDENIGVILNTIKVVSVATGEYRKLLNDYSVLSEDGLQTLYSQVFMNRNDRPVLLFDNKDTSNCNEYICHNICDVAHCVGYWLTWMGVYGYWKEDWENIFDKEKFHDYTFTTIDYLFQMLERKNKSIVYRFHYSDEWVYKRKRGGYNFFKVFVKDYLDLWNIYLENSTITQTLYKWIKKNLWSYVWCNTKDLLINKNINNYAVDDGWRILFHYYGTEWYFWWSLLKYPIASLRHTIKCIVSKYPS